MITDEEFLDAILREDLDFLRLNERRFIYRFRSQDFAEQAAINAVVSNETVDYLSRLIDLRPYLGEMLAETIYSFNSETFFHLNDLYHPNFDELAEDLLVIKDVADDITIEEDINQETYNDLVQLEIIRDFLLVESPRFRELYDSY
jgi:hypothetical protein